MNAYDNRREFLACLDDVQDWLAANRIPYAVIGGLAAAAYTGTGDQIDFDRAHAHDPTQRVPDIDLIVPRAALQAVHGLALAARQRTPLPVKVDPFVSATYLDLRSDGPTSYLTQRQLRMPVDTALFGPRRVELLGHTMVTIDPRVLLHTIATAPAAIRKKDVPKILGLAEAIKSGRAVSSFSERDCEVFSGFAAACKQRYPMYAAAEIAWKKTLDRLPPEAAQAFRSRLLPGIERTRQALNRSAESNAAGPPGSDTEPEVARKPRRQPRYPDRDAHRRREPDRSPEIEP